jgi:hypothetical protein
MYEQARRPGAQGHRRPGRPAWPQPFLEEAAREKLERIEVEAAIREGAGMLNEEDYPHWRDIAFVQEWLRACRRGELTADDLPAR